MDIFEDSSVEKIGIKDKPNIKSRNRKDDSTKTEEIFDTTMQSKKKLDSNEDEITNSSPENKNSKKHNSTCRIEELEKQQIFKQNKNYNVNYLTTKVIQEIPQKDFEKIKNSIIIDMEIKRLYKLFCGIKL